MKSELASLINKNVGYKTSEMVSHGLTLKMCSNVTERPTCVSHVILYSNCTVQKFTGLATVRPEI